MLRRFAEVLQRINLIIISAADKIKLRKILCKQSGKAERVDKIRFNYSNSFPKNILIRFLFSLLSLNYNLFSIEDIEPFSCWFSILEVGSAGMKRTGVPVCFSVLPAVIYK